jgi:hypothetical protein
MKPGTAPVVQGLPIIMGPGPEMPVQAAAPKATELDSAKVVTANNIDGLINSSS